MNETTDDSRLYPILEGRAWGFIDRLGRIVVPPRFKAADPFRDGLARVKGDKHFGFVDARGELVIDGLIEAYWFSCGRAKARRGKKYGYVGKDGRFVIEPRFLQCESFHEGFALAQDFETSVWGLIDQQGEWKIPPGSIVAGPFFEGLAARRSEPNGLIGYVDRDLKLVIPPRFSSAEPFYEGLAMVNEGDVLKFIDRHGRTAIEGPFSDPGGVSSTNGFHDGRARMCVGKLYGYLGREERGFVIPPRFRRASSFQEGRAPVGPDDGSESTTAWGYIDRGGRYVVRPVLYTAHGYEGGLARVHADPTREKVFGYIDVDGRWVWQPARGFRPELQDLAAVG